MCDPGCPCLCGHDEACPLSFSTSRTRNRAQIPCIPTGARLKSDPEPECLRFFKGLQRTTPDAMRLPLGPACSRCDGTGSPRCWCLGSSARLRMDEQSSSIGARRSDLVIRCLGPTWTSKALLSAASNVMSIAGQHHGCFEMLGGV